MNRYVNIPLTEINKKVAYKTVRYPEIPLTSDDIYVYIEQGDLFMLPGTTSRRVVEVAYSL